MTHDRRPSTPAETSPELPELPLPELPELPLPELPDLLALPELPELLALILNALAIPDAATAGDEPRRRQVLADRARHVVACLRAVLDDPADMAAATDRLRDHLDENPPLGYRHAQS